MGLKLYSEDSIQSIASAIRAKFNTNSSFTVTEMSQFLSSASLGGGTYVNDYTKQVSVLSVPTCSVIPNYGFYSNSVITNVTFDDCTQIYYSAFQSCSNLVSATFPACISVYAGAFAYCSNLQTVSLPECKYIYFSTFYPPFVGCSSLKTISLPKLISVTASVFNNLSLVSVYLSTCTLISTSAFGSNADLTLISAPSCSMVYPYAFRYCYSLSNVDLPLLQFVGSNAFAYCSRIHTFKMGSGRTTATGSSFISRYAFRGCWNLLSFYLLTPYVTGLSSIDAFYSTPISTYTTSTGGVNGSIFVPTSLLASYKAATNWVTYSDRMVGV